MTERVRRLAPGALGVSLLLAVVAACGGAAAPSATPTPTTGPSPAAPSPSASPGGSPAAPVDTPEAAVARVVAEYPEFGSLQPFNPDMVGQCCWHRVTPTADGFEVVMRVGWGDCPAGCIDEHIWTFHVGNDGRVELVSESGDPVEPGVIPSPSG